MGRSFDPFPIVGSLGRGAPRGELSGDLLDLTRVSLGPGDRGRGRRECAASWLSRPRDRRGDNRPGLDPSGRLSGVDSDSRCPLVDSRLRPGHRPGALPEHRQPAVSTRQPHPATDFGPGQRVPQRGLARRNPHSCQRGRLPLWRTGNRPDARANILAIVALHQSTRELESPGHVSHRLRQRPALGPPA